MQRPKKSRCVVCTCGKVILVKPTRVRVGIECDCGKTGIVTRENITHGDGVKSLEIIYDCPVCGQKTWKPKQVIDEEVRQKKGGDEPKEEI